MFYLNTDIDSPERYDISRFMRFTDDFDILDSHLIHTLKTLEVGGTFKVSSEVGRPDILSGKIYGDIQFWWIIMLYNEIQSTEDIVAGMQIRYPLKSALENYYFSLKQLEKA